MQHCLVLVLGLQNGDFSKASSPAIQLPLFSWLCISACQILFFQTLIKGTKIKCLYASNNFGPITLVEINQLILTLSLHILAKRADLKKRVYICCLLCFWCVATNCTTLGCFLTEHWLCITCNAGIYCGCWYYVARSPCCSYKIYCGKISLLQSNSQ